MILFDVADAWLLLVLILLNYCSVLLIDCSYCICCYYWF